MTATLELPVAKDAPRKRDQKPDAAADGDQDDTTVLAVAREIGEWVTDISKYATRKAKREGKPLGKKRIKNAAIVDRFLRRAVWELKMRCENRERGLADTEKIPPPPPSTLEPLPVELP